ncbi:MAG: putative porin [Bacteroidales bacterium]|nr:putative porin [Bacteroidales bacterium]
MNLFSRIAFPVAVTAFAIAGAMDFGRGPFREVATASESTPYGAYPRTPASLESLSDFAEAKSRDRDGRLMPTGKQAEAPGQDTVIYPVAGYKLRRTLSLEEITVRDTSGAVDEAADSVAVAVDTVVRLSPRDSLRALLDSSLWDKIDSIYLADSIARAKAEFEAWYAGLSPQERKQYDMEQRVKRKMALADSLAKVKEERRNIRDSIAETTPRILETYALPDSLFYKRLLAWTRDPDFGKMTPYVPDTTYNYRFHDYPFLRQDVNATWLGVAGSPVQSYNWFLRRSGEGVEFYDAQESWSYSHRNLPHYNTKVPYTELAYFGTLFAAKEKESDDLHLFTSQNITPALNISLLYDRYGGGGILEREQTVNKTTVVQANYLGKRYTMHAGYIYNMVSRQENGGMREISWIRDTTVNPRDIRVNLSDAKSKIKKNTVFLDQQLRIPFTFINRLRAKRDSTYVFNADSLDRDITTAFIGHSTEWSNYVRNYNDAISDEFGAALYNDVFRYGAASADSMRVMRLDNKVYIRLQPWSDEGIVSRLDVGVGDYLKHYFDSTALRPMRHVENSFYLYAGAEGQLRSSAFWDAKARYVLLGHDFGDLALEGNLSFRFFPFRRARKSPVSLSAHFETTLEEPTFYQQHLNLNHYSWDNDFGKISTTRLQGRLDIPHWKLSADVGYALLGNNLYYDTAGIIRQNGTAMSVLSASLRKEFKAGPVHFDHRALFQVSSNPEVLPLPAAAFNFRYYLEFVVQRNEQRQNVMTMQIGADAWYNTPWYSPSWNPNLGVFHNQEERLYTNGPFFDLFVNVQWKRACVFVKYQNAGGGWPLLHPDYFSADRYTVTQNGMDGLKFGIYWPFYTQPANRIRSSGSQGTSRGSSAQGASQGSFPQGAGRPSSSSSLGTTRARSR